MSPHPVDRSTDRPVDTAIDADPPPLPCAHFDAGRCRSCTLLPVPTRRRLDDLQRDVAALLDPFAAHDQSHSHWRPPIRSPEAGFRNKAKMVAGGTAEQPTLGLVDVEGHGIDLSDCPLYPPAIHATLAALPALIRRAQVPPYDVARRRGELKHVLVTASPDDELMVRFVLRTQRPVPRIREHIRLLTDAVAADGYAVRVVTANIQPEHTAVLEGPDEIPLHGDEALTVRQGRVPLRVRPQSFLQTNTHVASQLYEQVAAWVDETAAEVQGPSQLVFPGTPGTTAPTRVQSTTQHDSPGTPEAAPPAEVPPATQPGSPFVVWDLFCGVGGFALHCAVPLGDMSRRVVGVEVSAQAIESATRTASALGLAAEFTTADASLFATRATGSDHAAAQDPAASGGAPAAQDHTEVRDGAAVRDDAAVWDDADAPPPHPHPDLLIVNPPRRGLGADLAAWIEDSDIRDVIYSSCNPTTLAQDLRRMPSYRITAARILDMFPHTAHAEVVVRLSRIGPHPLSPHRVRPHRRRFDQAAGAHDA